MASELPVSPLALLPLVVFVFYSIYSKATRPLTAFDLLPWGGLPKGWFAKTRARFSVQDARSDLQQLWRDYSSKGASFVWQSFLSAPMIILPGTEIRWMLDQPETVLNGHEFNVDSLQFDVTLLDARVLTHPLHAHVISNELTRNLAATLAPVQEELEQCFDEYWGMSTEWRTVTLWDDMLKIFARTSNRVFVGEELCRNEDFIKNVVEFAQAVPTQGILLRVVPVSLRPILTWIFLIPIRRYYKKATKYLTPVVEKRMADVEKKERDADFEYEEPSDLLQWNILNAWKNPDRAIEWTTALISKRYMATSFAAVHTTALTSTNVLFDIVAADPKYNALETVREEVIRVYEEENRQWSKAGLAKLVRLDSCLRESLRLRFSGGIALGRTVMKKGGLTARNGTHLPQGAHVGILTYGIHFNPDNYEQCEIYDPFRYSRAREEIALKTKDKSIGETDRKELLRGQNLSVISTSESYLPFGHGKTACPGRFFAIQEIKLMIAFLLLNYEFKPLAKRPSNPWIKDMQIAHPTATITMRRIKNPTVS